MKAPITLRSARAVAVAGALAVLALSSSAAASAKAQSLGSDPPYPAPGRLVDLGGWRLHLNFSGAASSSQPTVILEAGIGAFSVDWALVQPRVANFGKLWKRSSDDRWTREEPG